MNLLSALQTLSQLTVTKIQHERHSLHLTEDKTEATRWGSTDIVLPDFKATIFIPNDSLPSVLQLLSVESFSLFTFKIKCVLI